MKWRKILFLWKSYSGLIIPSMTSKTAMPKAVRSTMRSSVIEIMLWRPHSLKLIRMQVAASKIKQCLGSRWSSFWQAHLVVHPLRSYLNHLPQKKISKKENKTILLGPQHKSLHQEHTGKGAQNLDRPRRKWCQARPTFKACSLRSIRFSRISWYPPQFKMKRVLDLLKFCQKPPQKMAKTNNHQGVSPVPHLIHLICRKIGIILEQYRLRRAGDNLRMNMSM